MSDIAVLGRHQVCGAGGLRWRMRKQDFQRRASDLQRAGHLLEHVNQPGGGLQYRDALRQLRSAKGVVEQFEGALVAGMASPFVAELVQPREQFDSLVFDIVVALAEIAAHFAVSTGAAGR